MFVHSDIAQSGAERPTSHDTLPSTAACPLPSKPAEPALQAPRESPDGPGTWFEAPCGSGRMHLCVGPGAPAAQHAAEAAILLRDIEPLLGPIDDWTGAECAWRWVDAGAPCATGSLAQARWRADAPQRDCVLAWPLASLRSLPAPPHALAARLDWSLMATVLVLARLQIDSTELDLLEPGGAVLLPSSLQPRWQGWMRAADEGCDCGAGIAVDLSTPWRPRLAACEAPTPAGLASLDGMEAACELRLDVPLRVSAHRLAGWLTDGDAGEIVHLAESGLRAALWRAATPRHAERRIAAGRLMPWGDGWALAVETLAADCRTPGGEGPLQKD